MRSAGLLAFAILASGCPGSDAPPARATPDAPADALPDPSDERAGRGATKADGAAAGKDRGALFRPLEVAAIGARTHVVAMGHDGLSGAATVAAWSLTAGGPALVGQVTIEALPIASWPGHTRTLVAYGSGDMWIAVEPSGEELALVRRNVDGRIVARVAIGRDAPAAIHAVGDRALIGLAAKIGVVDFASATPTLAILHERADMYGKPYDLFVQRGDWLVAIDDEVAPIFADTFTIGAAEIRHDQAWDMPTFVNGSYFAAEVVTDGERTGTLYALAHYGVRSGSGQDLVALPIERGKLSVGGDVVLNRRALASPPVLEEHRSDDPSDPSQLIAGTEMTPFRGLAFAPAADTNGRVLLAAGERGLLSVPAAFGPMTKADTIEVGGTCLDVRSHFDAIHVLVAGTGDAELVVLDAESLAVRSRHALAGTFNRLL